MTNYWHFVNDDGTLTHDMDNVRVEAGLTVTVDGEIAPCERGLHASKRALDALKYAPGAHVCLVTLGGEVVEDGDKAVATERTVIAHADATRVLHEFALWCAEQALALVDNPNPRSIEALAVKRRWLDGEATDAELAAASDAAWYALWSATRGAARDAARYAANDAAWYAARYASWSATMAVASEAARAAAWYVQNDELERRLYALLGVEVE